MPVTSASWRGSQGGTGIPESSEDMPGKSLNEGTVTRNDTQPLQRISTEFCLGNSKRMPNYRENLKTGFIYWRLNSAGQTIRKKNDLPPDLNNCQTCCLSGKDRRGQTNWELHFIWG